MDDQSGIKEVLLSVDGGEASKGSTLELKGLTPGIHQAKAGSYEWCWVESGLYLDI